MDEYWGDGTFEPADVTTWEPTGPWKRTLVVRPRTTITGKKTKPLSMLLWREYKSNKKSTEVRFAESIFEILQEKK